MRTSFNRTITVVLLGTVAIASGCDTNAAREEISQRTNALRDVVRHNPESSEAKEAMKQLIAIMNGNWSFGSTQAAGALKELGPLAAPAVPALIRASERRSDMFTQGEAIKALGEIGPEAAPAVDMLIRTIEKGLAGQLRTDLDWTAAEALGKIGEPAIKAIPVLERATKSSERFLVEEAQASLIQLKPLANTQSEKQ